MRSDPATAIRNPRPAAGEAWRAVPPGGVAGIAAAAAPGEILRISAAADACADAVRAVLGCGLLLLLRTQRRDDGTVLITAVRPERPAG